jgi:hypothetical protein
MAWASQAKLLGSESFPSTRQTIKGHPRLKGKGNKKQNKTKNTAIFSGLEVTFLGKVHKFT